MKNWIRPTTIWEHDPVPDALERLASAFDMLLREPPSSSDADDKALDSEPATGNDQI